MVSMQSSSLSRPNATNSICYTFTMNEQSESGERPRIQLRRIEQGKVVYTPEVIDAFNAAMDKGQSYDFIARETLRVQEELFEADFKQDGLYDKFWHRTYHEPYLPDDPDQPIAFSPSASMTRHEGAWNSSLSFSLYPEKTRSKQPNKVTLNVKGLGATGIDMYTPDRLALSWGIDGQLSRIGLSAQERSVGEGNLPIQTLFRDKLNQLYQGATDHIMVPALGESGLEIRVSLDEENQVIIQRVGGAPTKAYRVPRLFTPGDTDRIKEIATTPELLEHTDTASTTEDIWRGLQIFPTFRISPFTPQ